jgi:sodium-dependent dicarboxylate transporter 2/3/5
MAIWWITEAIPIPATALLPLALFPLLTISKAGVVARAYGDSNIFLFMGGFFLAMAMQRCNLHRRIALQIIHLIGTRPRRIVLGFMVATAFLSMWISNTATTMMVYPIALAVVLHFDLDAGRGNNFKTVLMLGIAYAASIGGLGTLVGTPPNIVFAAAVKSLYPEAPPVDFLRWMMVGLPVVVLFLPAVWLLLTRFVYRVGATEAAGGGEVIAEQLAQLGKPTTAERRTFVVFVATALAWIFRRDLQVGVFSLPGWSSLLGVGEWVNDATVAIVAALVLFVVPSGGDRKGALLDWDWAVRIPWGILILFGGGIALAEAFKTSGLAEWIALHLHALQDVPILVLILSVCLMLTFLTEVTSNTATATIFMPVLAATATATGLHPFLLMIPATLSASCAFMLPVATPPNAIVFGSGHVAISDMARAGLILNLLGAVLITAVVYLVAIPVFGITFGELPVWAQ